MLINDFIFVPIMSSYLCTISKVPNIDHHFLLIAPSLTLTTRELGPRGAMSFCIAATSRHASALVANSRAVKLPSFDACLLYNTRMFQLRVSAHEMNLN